MMLWATLLPPPLRRLAGNCSGIAITELALSLPIFLFLVLGGLEISNLVMAHTRVNQIAITVADNAGRVNAGIDESNIYEVFAGVDLVGGNLDFANNGRLVLSSLQPNGQAGANAGQMINWQRCYGALDVDPSYGTQGTGRTSSTLAAGMGPAGRRIVAESGTAVMFVEVTYNYTPLFFDVLNAGEFIIRYESAFNVRERTNNNITNTQNLTLRSCT